MKNKGFTLVELLAAITILALLAAIISPKVIDLINSSEETLSKQQINRIIDAAKKYVVENSNELPNEDGSSVYITTNTLIEKGIIDNETIIDPKTKDVISGCVIIKYSNDYNQYIYQYTNDCAE